MSKRNLKLMSAGVLVAVAFGVVALRVAWATPSEGVTPQVIAGPVELDEIDIGHDTDTHEVEIKTKGEWAGRVMRFTVVPGGHFGWHSHPGPAFVMIEAGTMSLYHADDPNPKVYPAGTGFVEHPGHVHIARNEGPVALEVIAFLLHPAGEPFRTDEPLP